MAATPANLSIDDLERIRAQFYHADPRCCWVTRAISLAVSRYLRGTRIFPEDIFQSCYAKVLVRFPAIFQSFLQAEGSQKSSEGFEKYLSRAINNQVRDSLRSEKIRTVDVPDDSMILGNNYSPDPDRLVQLQRWQLQALQELEPLEQRILWRRLVDRTSPENIAVEEQISKDQFSRLVHRAKLKMKMALIRQVVQRKQEQFDLLDRHLIENRCQKKHPCYLYRLDCPQAHDLTTLVGRFDVRLFPKSSEPHELIAKSFSKLEATIRDLLDDWDLDARLESCLWAK